MISLLLLRSLSALFFPLQGDLLKAVKKRVNIAESIKIIMRKAAIRVCVHSAIHQDSCWERGRGSSGAGEVLDFFLVTYNEPGFRKDITDCIYLLSNLPAPVGARINGFQDESRFK